MTNNPDQGRKVKPRLNPRITFPDVNAKRNRHDSKFCHHGSLHHRISYRPRTLLKARQSSRHHIQLP